MSTWEERLKAVAVLGVPSKPVDGEVICLNPTCRNEKLNRSDMTCWRCGMDRFGPNSDEMRHALRFNYVPPPRMEEKPAASPVPASSGHQNLTLPAGWPFYYSPQTLFNPAAPAAPPATDPYTALLDSWAKQQRAAGLGPSTVLFYDPPPEPTRFRRLIGQAASSLALAGRAVVRALGGR